jgi:hypothetical protein
MWCLDLLQISISNTEYRISKHLGIRYSTFDLLEHLLPACQYFVERFSEERRGVRHLRPNLLNVFLPAFLDFFVERFLYVSSLERLLPLFRLVDNHV